MRLNFVIPLHRDDLKKADQINQYFVKNVYDVRELKSKLKELELQVNRERFSFGRSEGCFDALFSLLVHYQRDVSESLKKLAFSILLTSADKLISNLDIGIDSSHSEKSEKLNDMKMIFYLLTQYIENIEGEYSSKLESLDSKKISTKKRNESWNWEENRVESIHLIYKLLQLNIQNLFEPPIVEEEFISCIANSVFRILETPSVSQSRFKALRASLYQVLGTLNHKFEYFLSCSVKIVQELKHFEHLVTPLSEAVEIFVKEYNGRSLVNDVVREISRIELTKDTSASRSYSQFLGELGERLPKEMMTTLPYLLPHLDGDSYSLRKSVLSILSEILISILSGESLDDKSKEYRDNYLTILEEHVHDVHAHVRSSVLQSWSKCCRAKAIPLKTQHRLLSLVKGRLEDKSSNVRKQAVLLLTTLLQCNPYTYTLPIEDLAKEYEMEKSKLLPSSKEILFENENGELQSLMNTFKDVSTTDVWENCLSGEVSSRLYTYFSRKNYEKGFSLLKGAIKAFPSDFSWSETCLANLVKLSTQETETEEFSKQKRLVNYLKDSLTFAKVLNEALPVLCVLLGSKVLSDVLEAIEFFVSAFEFGLLNALMGIRQMLSLIWSKEKVVRDSVVEAYKRLYLPESVSPLQVVRNLMALVHGASVGEMTSLEELIKNFVLCKDLTKESYSLLWQIFTRVHPTESCDTSEISALILLGMIATVEPSIISNNLSILMSHAFGERGKHNFRLVSEAASAILKASSFKKFDADHELFVSLETILVSGITESRDGQYIPMAKQVITLIYSLSETPDLRAESILRQLTQITKDFNKAFIIKRLLFVLGQVAVCQLKHLDVAIFCELKRRNALRTLKDDKKTRKRQSFAGSSASETPRNTVSTTSDPPPNSFSNEDEEAGDADDVEGEFIRSICEKDIVTGSNLLSYFAPFVIQSCHSNGDIQRAASLTLVKFMLVSNEFCESHLRLLFTLLEKSSDVIIRSNCIIATGDLSVRFPNTLEPWTPRMYACLRDESPKVKRNTLTVLTHLILNDMIKVKGQISDMAFSIVDEDDSISSLAKLFFTELSRKGNALYNIMPDIISRLSDIHVGIQEIHFQTILKYIVSLIEKDRQLESLVEKICYRFRLTKTERQWRDLSYVLSLFNYSEKTLKKLIENFHCIKETLHENVVHDNLMTLLSSTRKNAKLETKNILDEFEIKIEEARQKCLEDQKTHQRAVGVSDKKQKVQNNNNNNSNNNIKYNDDDTKKKENERNQDKEDEDYDDTNQNDENEKTIKQGFNSNSQNDNDDDYDDDDDAKDFVSTKKTKTRSEEKKDKSSLRSSKNSTKGEETPSSQNVKRRQKTQNGKNRQEEIILSASTLRSSKLKNKQGIIETEEEKEEEEETERSKGRKRLSTDENKDFYKKSHTGKESSKLIFDKGRKGDVSLRRSPRNPVSGLSKRTRSSTSLSGVESNKIKRK